MVQAYSNQNNLNIVAKAIVEATTHYQDAELIADVSTDLGKAMSGLEISDIPENERLQNRW